MLFPALLLMIIVSMWPFLRGTGQAVWRQWHRFYWLAVASPAAYEVWDATSSLIEVRNLAVELLVRLLLLAVEMIVTFLFMLKALNFCHGKPFKTGPALISLLRHPPYARSFFALTGVFLGIDVLFYGMWFISGLKYPDAWLLYYGPLLIYLALLYFMIRMIVFAPVVVFEKAGPVEGGRRSFSLTRAATFRVFSLLILFFLVFDEMMWPFMEALYWVGLGPPPLSSMRDSLAWVFIVGPLLALVGNFGILIIYFELTDNTAFRQRLTDGETLVTPRNDGEDGEVRDHD